MESNNPTVVPSVSKTSSQTSIRFSIGDIKIFPPPTLGDEQIESIIKDLKQTVRKPNNDRFKALEEIQDMIPYWQNYVPDELLGLRKLLPGVSTKYALQVLYSKLDPLDIAKLAPRPEMQPPLPLSIPVQNMSSPNDDFTDLPSFLDAWMAYTTVMIFCFQSSVPDIGIKLSGYLRQLLSFTKNYTWETVLFRHLQYHKAIIADGGQYSNRWLNAGPALDFCFHVKGTTDTSLASYEWVQKETTSPGGYPRFTSGTTDPLQQNGMEVKDQPCERLDRGTKRPYCGDGAINTRRKILKT
ncbi:MAG: hypothetical protein M1834_004929 [Cirrosporium novae-zelandiae]|nr:MAG: hypothetical protein M1834_004929 [Cirrosporium novae-zelandiae]